MSKTRHDTTKTAAAKKTKVLITVSGKKTVKCNKKIKLTAKVKGASGKIKWSVGSKAKKYIKLSKKTGKTVIIKAGKKTGTYAICVMCNKYKKTFKIKVKK